MKNIKLEKTGSEKFGAGPVAFGTGVHHLVDPPLFLREGRAVRPVRGFWFEPACTIALLCA